MEHENPRRRPIDDAITEELIRELVHGFYARIRKDEVLGPIFARVIGENWNPHLAKMCDFWSSVMRMTRRYKGNPMAAHLRHPIEPEFFDRWLALFGETADEVVGPEAARLFRAKAATIAESLKLALFFRPRRARTTDESPTG